MLSGRVCVVSVTVAGCVIDMCGWVEGSGRIREEEKSAQRESIRLFELFNWIKNADLPVYFSFATSANRNSFVTQSFKTATCFC